MVPVVNLDCEALAKSGDMIVRAILTAATRVAQALPDGDACVSIALTDDNDEFIAAFSSVGSEDAMWRWREGELRLTDFIFIRFVGLRHTSVVRVEFTPVVVQ